MGESTRTSPRRDELLERAYRYALEHGLAELSLRPLATATGTSPRVLLFLFDSKEGLVRTLLERARADELALLERVRRDGANTGLPSVVRSIWTWLADPAHRSLLTLWAEAYTRSLIEPDGPWADFARRTVEDWLSVLAAAQPAAHRDEPPSLAERTLALTVLRGALLDLLATGDVDRTTAAVERYHSQIGPP